VADREHRLLDGIELADETLDFRIGSDSVGRRSAGDQKRVEIFGGAIGDELFGAKALSVVEAPFAANPLTRPLVETNDGDDRTGLFEGPAGLRHLNFFEPVADKSGDALSFYSLHIGRVIRAGP